MHFEAGDIALRLVVSAWLVFASVADVRRRELSHRLSTLPLIVTVVAWGIAGVVHVRSSGWNGAVWDSVAIILAFGTVAASDSWWALLPGVASVGIAFWLGTEKGLTVSGVWLLWLGLAKAGIVGAGDSKVMMVLIALFPDWLLAVIVAALIVAVGSALLLQRVGPASVFVVLGDVRHLLAGQVPARTGEQGILHIPLVPLLAAGAGLYMWLPLAMGVRRW